MSNNNFDNKKDALMDEVRDVLSEAESLYNSVVDDGSEQARVTREKLKKQLEKAKEQFGDIEAKVSAKAREAAKQANEVVQDKPYHVIGTAAVAGLVLGMLLRGGCSNGNCK